MFYNRYKELFFEENKIPYENQINKLHCLKIKKPKSLPKIKFSSHSYNINEIFNNKLDPNFNQKYKDTNYKEKYYKNNNFKIKNINSYNANILEKNKNNDKTTFDKLNKSSKRNILLSNKNKINLNKNFYNTILNNNNIKKNKFLEIKDNLFKKEIKNNNINKQNKNYKEKLRFNSLRNSSKNIKDIFDSMKINENNHKKIDSNNTKQKLIIIPNNIKIKKIKDLISKILPEYLFSKLMLDKNNNKFLKAIKKRVKSKYELNEKKLKLKKMIL